MSPTTNTGMYVSKSKLKIPRTDQLSIDAAREELKKINELISSYPQPEEIWDKKRRLLAILNTE